MLNDAEVERYKQLPHVADILPTKIIMTACGSAGDTISVHGIDREKIHSFRDYQIDPTVYTQWLQVKNGVIVGEQIFKRYHWKIGEQVSLEELGGVAFTICGTFKTENSNESFLIIADRDYLQKTQNQQGISSLVWIKLNPGYEVADAISAIEKVPLTAHVSVKLAKAHLMAALGQFKDLLAASRYVMVIILTIILVAIGNTVSMTVRERYSEFAIMRTIGYSKTAILYMVLCDSIIMTFIGGLIGCLLLQGVVWAEWVKGIKSCDINIIFTSDYSVWLKTLLAVTMAGFIGALLPAYSAAKINILDGIRKED